MSGGGGRAGKRALQIRAPWPIVVCVGSSRASRRLRSGGRCRLCRPGHPPSDGSSSCCCCRVELRPIHRRQRDGKIPGAEAESEKGGAALPGAGSCISPLPQPASPPGARKEAAVSRGRRRCRWSWARWAQRSTEQGSRPGESFPSRAAGRALPGNCLGLGLPSPAAPSRARGLPGKTVREKSRNE